MATWMKDLWKIIEPGVAKVVGAVATLYRDHPNRVAGAILLVLVAVVTGVVYVDRVTQYQEIVSTTVRSEMEDTPQRYKVLEAFIMSTIDSRLSETVKRARLTDRFATVLEGIDALLASPDRADATIAAAGSGAVAPRTVTGIQIALPGYANNATTLPEQSAVVTDTEPDGYLFFPLSLIRTNISAQYPTIFEQSRKGESSALAAAVARDPVIADDILTSRVLVPKLRELTKLELFEDDDLRGLSAELRPVQVYYITKNGLNRIVNNSDAQEQQLVYRHMFRATTFFPSRPYFVEAFRRFTPGRISDPRRKASDLFYVSQPYFDIGGFGVVVTLAKPLRYDGHSDAALCLDLQVKIENDPLFQLKQKLQDFGATSTDVECNIGFYGRSECKGDVEYPLLKALENSLTEAVGNGDLSTVAGNINILREPGGRGEASRASLGALFSYPLELIFGYGTRPITFALPVRSPRGMSEKRGLTATFAVASLNLDRYVQITSLLGLTSVTLLLTALFVVLLSWQGEVKTRESFEEAFRTVDGVLYGATTAYCRLDNRDLVVDCNTAFCELLGMAADNQTVQALKGRTFESLIAPRSKGTYHSVQDRRRRQLEVEPYTLYFTRVDQTEIETRVTSGATPGRPGKELPGTFGIIIPSPNA